MLPDLPQLPNSPEEEDSWWVQVALSAKWWVLAPNIKAPARLRTNWQSMRLVQLACGKEEDIFGAIMSGECIHNLGTKLFSMNGEFKGEAQSNICRFGRNVLALANRTKDNFGIIYRYDTHDVCDTVSEELIHWKQELYNQRYADGYVNLASVADHLHWPVIHKALIDTYHPENLNNLVNEAGAKVALGKSAEVGLTPEEGREFLRFYCHLIIQMHGSAVATDILQYATKLEKLIIQAESA